MVLEKTLESPLDSRRSNQSILKETSPEYSLERHAEAGAPIPQPPDVKSRFTGKAPDAGNDGRWEEKGTTEDEMVGWHHRLNGREFEQTWEIVKDREAWRAAVHGVSKGQT